MRIILPRLAEGGTVVCLASGPSLTARDVNYVRGKAVVIAINDAVQLAPWADVLYSSDKTWLRRHSKSMRGFSGLRVAVHNGQDKPTQRPVDGTHCQGCRMRLPSVGSCWCAGITVLRNAGPHGLSLDPEFLCTGENSGSAAINVAVHLGAVRILLLGYDMGPYQGRRHFFDTAPTMCSSPFQTFRKRMATMVQPLKNAGVEVINCSRRTALECFPLMALEDALPMALEVAS